MILLVLKVTSPVRICCDYDELTNIKDGQREIEGIYKILCIEGIIMQTEVEEKIANRECDQNMSVNRESYKTRRTPVFIRELVVSIEHPEDAEC